MYIHEPELCPPPDPLEVVVVKSVSSRLWFDNQRFEAIVRPIEAVAFWSAIALPFLHIPLLLYGLETNGRFAAFVGLLGLNVIAFIVGHRYGR